MRTLSLAARLTTTAAVLAALAVLALACGGGNGARVTEVTAVVSNSELAVGENRFVVGLLDQDTEAVTGAEVAFRFFKLDGDQETPKGEAKATAVTVERSYTHTHADGKGEKHSAGETGVYGAHPTFDEAGSWGVEVTATIEGKTLDPVGAAFPVLQGGASWAVGAPAPRSNTLTL